ncbi:MAG: hypothetical protein L0206_16905 [Actinobacteria bacterium]|nr:hypothetical protein [Actinomycetota bacterium]
MARTVPIGIPFSHPHVYKSALPKTAVDDSPGSSLLGLTTTVGAKLISNAAVGNTKTDVCGWMFVVPDNWVERSTLVFRARCKQATTLLTVGTVVSVTAKLQGDDTVGSDIVTLASEASRTLTVTLANFDVGKISGSSLRRGDHLWGTFTLALDDTGGSVNTAAWCTRLWMVCALES